MKIINDRIIEDINNKKPLKLELGSGGKGKKGFYSVDLLEMEGVDVVADLNLPLKEIPDNSVSHIFSSHAFEHINDFMMLMKEIYRILIPEGKLDVIVPHFSNPYYYSDPTHVRFFGLYTMNYFVSADKQPPIRQVPAFYTDARFEVESIFIKFYRRNLLDRIWVPIIRKIININFSWQDFYERKLSNIFRASEIRYILIVDKS